MRGDSLACVGHRHALGAVCAGSVCATGMAKRDALRVRGASGKRDAALFSVSVCLPSAVCVCRVSTVSSVVVWYVTSTW